MIKGLKFFCELISSNLSISVFRMLQKKAMYVTRLKSTRTIVIYYFFFSTFIYTNLAMKYFGCHLMKSL